MKTALYDHHIALSAKIVDFAGWEMPIQYKGIIQEHHAVRQKVGIFDVSHMGRILISGKDAEPFLDYLSTNKIAGKQNFSATYTVWSDLQGGCVDDVLIYKQDTTHFFVVVNAGNREKDLQHLRNYSKDFEVQIEARYEDGILAIQGPDATSLVSQSFQETKQLKPMTFVPVTYQGQGIILSATGYTGAGGFEIYAPQHLIVELWKTLIQKGAEPVGLGARDTLRLEMGFALYGHEISETIAAVESVSAWTVKWDKKDFLGKAALEKIEQPRSEHGIVLLEKGIAREGYDVFKEGKHVGYVTSGTYSPTLDKAIAIVLVDNKLQEGDQVEVQVRSKRCQAKVVSLPFI